MKRAWIIVGAVGLLVALAVPSFAQTGKNSGVMLYKQYCATCHGLDGKGAGPTAPSLKKAPTDLTTMQPKGGAFPGERVVHTLQGEAMPGPHGTADMPVWGQVFRYTKRTPPSELAVNRLVEYIKTIQVNK